MYTPQQTADILLLRQKVNAGTITQEELKKGIELLRSAREGAHATSAASRGRKSASAAKANIDSNSLLDELGGL